MAENALQDKVCASNETRTEMNTSPVTFHSVEVVVARYQSARKVIEDACLAIAKAHQEISEAFGEDCYVHLETRDLQFQHPDHSLTEMDRRAWRHIINKTGVRKFMSVSAAKEMDDQLAQEKRVPGITVEGVKGFIEAQARLAPEYLAAAVKEVHDFLRPTRSRHKTNTEFDIGERVILTNMVRVSFTAGRFAMGYWGSATDRTRALDNVFALLDGKPWVTTHQGWLADAICAADGGIGETEYFAFKCFGNGNLHLRFKRMDLVRKLNAVAGGRNLYAPRET